MNNLMTFYNRATDSTSISTVSLPFILQSIKSGKYRNMIDKIRNLASRNISYKDEKRNLPMFTPSGIFKHRNDDLNNLTDYTSFLVIDFDHFNTSREALDFKEKLIKYANPLHIYAIWISPSGLGVKALMIHDNRNPVEHTRMFMQVKRDLYPNTSQFDMRCGNISRGCFMSYDTELYINPNPIEPYHFVPDPSIQLSDSKRNNVNYNGSTQKEYQHTEEQLKWHSLIAGMERCEFGLMRDADLSLIDYMKKRWDKAFPDCYNDGNRHQSILSRASSFCKAGVLVDNAINHLISTFGKHGIEEWEIRNMVNYCYNMNNDSFGISRVRINDLRRQGRENKMRNLMGK